MGQTQTVFLPPWVPATVMEKERADDFKARVLHISETTANFVQPHPMHSHPDFEFDWVEHRPFAEAAYRADKRLFKMLPRIVPKRVSEEDFWRNYFSHVFAVQRQFEAESSTKLADPTAGTSASAGAPPESAPLRTAPVHVAGLNGNSLQTISYPEKFHLAVRYASEGPPLPNLSDADRILLEALFQQASVGQCNKPRPGMWDTAEEKAKYEAWKKLGNMSCAEAMHLYVQAIEVFNEDWMTWEGLGLVAEPHKRNGTAANGTAANGAAASAAAAAAAAPPVLTSALSAMRELRAALPKLPPAQLSAAADECAALATALRDHGVHAGG